LGLLTSVHVGNGALGWEDPSRAPRHTELSRECSMDGMEPTDGLGVNRPLYVGTVGYVDSPHLMGPLTPVAVPTTETPSCACLTSAR